MITSWRVECAEIWAQVAVQRTKTDDVPGYFRAMRNREILGAAQNISNQRPGSNWP